MTSPLDSPPLKRIKLEDISTLDLLENDDDRENAADADEGAEEKDEDNCSICLQPLVDRTVIPKCSHEFCFECLLLWTEQSRRCPLCTQAIGEYLIHSIRSRYDYRKHFLPPLRTSPPISRPARNNPILQSTRNYIRRRRREREWGPQDRDAIENDKLERSIEFRRWIYRHDVYAKHVASNAFTKYRPYPTPAQFSASQDLISRTTTFLRRELQVWEGLDVEFLTTLIISLMKAIDIRSESAVKLISEFLDMDAPYTPGGRHVNAEHFAHEVYCYVRSPYKDLFVYDSVVQYETPIGVSPPPNEERSQRHRPSSSRAQYVPSRAGQELSSSSRPRSRSRACSRSASQRVMNHSESWSPSGRRYSPLDDFKYRDVDEIPPVHELFDERPSTSRRRNDGSHHNSQPSKAGKSRKRDAVSPYDRDRDGSFSRTRATPPSTDIAEQYVPTTSASAKGKGKEKAQELDALAGDHSNKFSDRETDIDKPVPVLIPPQEKYSRNDVDQPLVDLPTPRPRISSSKTLRTPRVHSLVESVRAHLAPNNGPGTLAENLAEAGSYGARRALNGQAQLSVDEPGIIDRDIHHSPAEPSSIPERKYRGASDLSLGADGGATVTSTLHWEDTASKSLLVDDIGRGTFSQDKRSNKGNLQDDTKLRLRGSHPKIHHAHLKSLQSLSVEHGQVISTLNKPDNTLSAPSRPSNAASIVLAASVSKEHPRHADADIPIQRPLTNVKSSGSEPLHLTNNTPSPIGDRTRPHVELSHPPRSPSHANIPIRDTRHAKSVSITEAHHDQEKLDVDVRSSNSPHPQSQVGEAGRRTRLLVRLREEKARAGLAHDDGAARATDTLAGGPGHDYQRSSPPPLLPLAGSADTPGAHKLMQLNHVQNTRPDTSASAPENTAEEARVKEAQLRVRARLRARLAAEKRAGGVGE